VRRAIVSGLILAAGGLSMTVAAYQLPPGPRPEGLLQQPQGPWKPGMEARIEKLRDNVYRILNTGANCTAFVTRDNGVVLVESGYPGWGHEILDKLKSVTAKPITIVISTHTHVDHTGSNVELGMAQNIEFVAHENTRANLARTACANVGGCQNFQGENAKYLPTRTFRDRMSLLSGDDRIDLSYYGRAHTNGDIVVVFPALRLAHVGDLFAWHGVPRVMTEDGGSVVEFPETLAKAQAAIANVDTIITGHSRVMPWKEWIEVRDFLAFYVGEVKAARKAGKTVDEAVAGLKWPTRFNVCPPQDTFASQYAADYEKFHGNCVYRTDQLKADTEIAYRELEK
jgi:glyoxylase-like metal-dependent hydrolase (beta-lactamase superfamily II)